MTTARTYPKRPKMFVAKFIRKMVKTTVANELGTDVFTLLAVIASTEDAAGYCRPVNWHNEQLMAVAGIGSAKQLQRIRDKAVGSGWLHYEPGGRGRTPRYWVLVPDHAEGLDDLPTDEQPGELEAEQEEESESSEPRLVVTGDHQSGVNRGSDRGPVGSHNVLNRGSDRGPVGHTSFPCTVPSPVPDPKTPQPPAVAGPGPAAVGSVETVPAFRVFAEAWAASGLPPRFAADRLRSADRVMLWQQRTADPWWLAHWPEAVERAGRSAKARGEDPRFPRGVRIEDFLGKPDYCRRILEGEFDDPAPAGRAGGRDQVAEAFAAAKKLMAEGKEARDG